MIYLKNIQTGEVFGYDESDDTQLPYMQEKINAGYEDVTGNWPPPPEPDPVLDDPIERLKGFLAMNPDIAAAISTAEGA